MNIFKNETVRALLIFSGLIIVVIVLSKNSSLTNGLLLLLLLIGLYFLPAIVAYSNKKKNKVAITVLNLFLGWTLIGWVVCIVWSLTKD